MSKAFCLLNHQLTQNQLTELKKDFGVKEIINPSENLSKNWSQIPASKSLDMNLIQAVVRWLSSAQADDILIVQGEFGSTFMIVDYALKNGLIPLYAVTKRVAQESVDGELVHRQYVFEHVCFREYAYFSEAEKNIFDLCQFSNTTLL